MKRISALLAFVLIAAMCMPAAADTARLLPNSLNLSVVDGSAVPSDCMYPASITDQTRFEIACVTMPSDDSENIDAQYIGQLGRMGWRQGDFITGGMTAVRTDENHCQHVLNIFPADFPPGGAQPDQAVLWLALERAPRCGQGQGQAQ